MWNVRCGLIAAESRNAQRFDKKQKAWTWMDYFKPRKPQPQKKRLTLEEQREKFREMQLMKRGEL